MDAHDSEQGASLDDLVFECLERFESGGEAALEQLCADHPRQATALRERIERLRSAGLLSVAEGAAPLPERLGDFRLIRKLGAGGMGVVHLAHQESLGREVALKLIRPEQLYFPAARERFQREVRAIAKLQHPGIVPVYQVGEEAGLPYFAMERIDGCSLGDALAELQARDPATLSGADLIEVLRRRTSAEGRGEAASPLYDGAWVEVALRILREVAEALEHAHRRGILHRDVKPSNVMLTLGGRVLLVDFGCSQEESAGRLTRSGALLGSLPYLPPEQVDGRGAGSVAGDVYGMGVTLYELLTLRLPWQEESFEELRRAILHGAGEPTRRLNRRVPPELETVRACAMERDPARRYASAAELAQDLANVLERRPILARRAGALLRARRWTQRHPARAVAAALGSVLLVGGPLGWAVQTERANERVHGVNLRLEEANLALGATNLALEEALARVRAEGERARDALDGSLDAVDRMLARVSEERLFEQPRMEEVRGALLEDAVALYSRLAESWADEERLAWETAGARARLGRIQHDLHRFELAERELERGVAGYRAFLGSSERPTAARELAATLHELATLFGGTGRGGRALECLREAIALADADSDPEEAARMRGGYRYALGDALLREGDVEGSRSAFGAAIDELRTLEASGRATPRDRHVLAVALTGEGACLYQERKLAEAEGSYLESLALLEALRAEGLAGAAVEQDHMDVLHDLGLLYQVARRFDDAEHHAWRALEMQDELAARYPFMPQYRDGAANARLGLVGVLFQLRRLEEAREIAAEALELQRALVDEHPDVPGYRSILGGAYSSLAAVTTDQGDHGEAVRLFERSIAEHRRALESHPEHLDAGDMLGQACLGHADALSRLGRHEEAGAATRAAHEAMGVVDAYRARQLAGRFALCATLASQDASLEAAARDERAAVFVEEALELLRHAVDAGFTDLGDLERAERLAPLRAHPDFALLVERVRAGGS